VEAQPLEMILLRQVADHLATAVVLADAQGTLVFYNEAAERLMGGRFDELGEIPRPQWERAIEGVDEHGDPVPARDVPLAIALDRRQPAQLEYEAARADGSRRRMRSTAVPLIGQQDRFIGAIAFFCSEG
jgi:PAS domain S-box-containing protein